MNSLNLSNQLCHFYFHHNERLLLNGSERTDMLFACKIMHVPTGTIAAKARSKTLTCWGLKERAKEMSCGLTAYYW